MAHLRPFSTVDIIILENFFTNFINVSLKNPSLAFSFIFMNMDLLLKILVALLQDCDEMLEYQQGR